MINAATTVMRYYARSTFFWEFSSKGNFWLDMTSSFQVRIPLLSLDKLGEKLPATIILGKFENKHSLAHSFGKRFSLVRIKSTFT